LKLRPATKEATPPWNPLERLPVASHWEPLVKFALFQKKNHARSAFQWLSTPSSLTNPFHHGKNDASSLNICVEVYFILF